jgi:hypothetical protein
MWDEYEVNNDRQATLYFLNLIRHAPNIYNNEKYKLNIAIEHLFPLSTGKFQGMIYFFLLFPH